MLFELLFTDQHKWSNFYFKSTRKMSKKLTNRGGRSDKSSKKTKVIQSNLNNSDEDFVSVVDKPKRNNETDTQAQDDYRSASSSSSPCPFCGKSFASSLARASHLKACGNQLGVDTNQLLKIKKLEDKQAQEWKDLNLPSIVTTNNTESIKSKSCNKTKSAKAKAKSEFLASNDPQLEIALALSASLTASSNEVQGTKCWLPQPPPAAKVKPFKSKAKTALQVRPDDQRKQQMLEIVSAILESKQNSSCSTIERHYDFIDTVFENHSKSILWCLAAFNPILPSDHYCIDLFKPYIIKKDKVGKRISPPQSEEINEPEDNEESAGLLKLSKAWNKLFQNGDKSDVLIYARDEEEIKVHALVLHVRCPKMLRSSMRENDTQIISCPEVSAYILRSFIKLLYTGRLVVTLRNENDIQDAKYLANTFPQVDQWRTFVENINNPSFAGFAMEEDEDIAEIASQNLSGLLDILEEEETSENESEVDEEWSEMCEVLQSQKSLTTQSPHGSKDDRSESPDIFGSDSDNSSSDVDDTNDTAANDPQSERKRKSIIDNELDQSDCKKSKLDLDSSYENDDDQQIDPNASQYSRQNVSTPSILQDLEVSRNETKAPSASCTTPLMHQSVMPDYESMLSPALQQELQRFGLKVIPRRKAVPLLKHIFEETHPSNPIRRKVNFEAAEEESEEVLTQNR